MNRRSSIPWPHRRGAVLAALAACLGLAGCFGGSDDEVAAVPSDPLAAVPAAVSTSAQAAVDYQRQLSALPSETREPIALGDLVLPSSESDEPRPVE